MLTILFSKFPLHNHELVCVCVTLIIMNWCVCYSHNHELVCVCYSHNHELVCVLLSYSVEVIQTDSSTLECGPSLFDWYIVYIIIL